MGNIAEKISWLWGAFTKETKPVAVTAGKMDKGIISQLAREYTDRSRSDIKKWRDAIQAAINPEDPRWVLVQDLYENLLTDGHLGAVIAVRKAATLCSRFYIEDKSGKEDAEKSTLLKTDWFYHIMEHALDSILRGYTVIELTNPALMRWTLIPRRNVSPQKTMIWFEATGQKGVNYSDPAFSRNIIELQSINIFGILNDIVPQLIWKRNTQQIWADFTERFGIPMVTAETTKTDKTNLDRIEEALKKVGQALQTVLPEGTTITIHDQVTKGDPHKVYLEMIKLANDEIAKSIVGGNMITDDGSSRSQSEVHERTLDEKLSESDRRMVEFFVNGKLIPLLRTYGFKFADGDVFRFDRTENLTMTQHWSIINQALLFYEIDPEWVSKRFNFPITSVKTFQPSIQQSQQALSQAIKQQAFSSNFQ